MPSIHEIAGKISNFQNIERNTHLKNLSNYTKRNVISYYADFMSGKEGSSSITDADMHGFMSTVHQLDKNIGLDLILHTPGGIATATESIVVYLKSIFGKNIRAIVPHMAMSAGTMLACACKEIVMGKHSSLGPIDPQFAGVPAIDIISEFDKAHEEISANQENFGYWSLLLNKYPVGTYERCKKELELSEFLVKSWLSDNMLSKKQKLTSEVVEKLNENNDSKTHSRHFDKDFCRKIGLKIFALESDPELQDLVLSVHHCYMYLFSTSNVIKIIENHNGIQVLQRVRN